MKSNDEVMELYLTKEDIKLLKWAAAQSHMSLEAFVKQSVMMRVERTLSDGDD